MPPSTARHRRVASWISSVAREVARTPPARRIVEFGTGDLSVLAERDLYRETRVDRRSVDVRIWSSDHLLRNWAET